MAAPSTDQRQECYEARDAFYQCMAKNDEHLESCKGQEKDYHGKCLNSWVSHYLYIYLLSFVVKNYNLCR